MILSPMILSARPAATCRYRARKVKAENNQTVTQGESQQRLAELATFIEDKFGARHRVANRRRVPTR